MAEVGHLCKGLRARYSAPLLDPTPGEDDVTEEAQLREDEVQVLRSGEE